jgi:hypothetical protein
VNGPTIEQVEDVLCLAYEQQAEKYEQALRISEGLPTSLAQDSNPVDLLEQLRSALDEVADLSSRAQTARRQWESLGRQPGSRLRKTLQRLEPTLRKLIEVMASAEEHAREARDRLSPKLSRESRGRQMRQAYASVVAQSCELAEE